MSARFVGGESEPPPTNLHSARVKTAGVAVSWMRRE